MSLKHSASRLEDWISDIQLSIIFFPGSIRVWPKFSNSTESASYAVSWCFVCLPSTFPTRYVGNMADAAYWPLLKKCLPQNPTFSVEPVLPDGVVLRRLGVTHVINCSLEAEAKNGTFFGVDVWSLLEIKTTCRHKKYLLPMNQRGSSEPMPMPFWPCCTNYSSLHLVQSYYAASFWRGICCCPGMTGKKKHKAWRGLGDSFASKEVTGAFVISGRDFEHCEGQLSTLKARWRRELPG